MSTSKGVKGSIVQLSFLQDYKSQPSGTTVYGEPAIGNDAMSVAECDEGEVVMRLRNKQGLLSITFILSLIDNLFVNTTIS